MRLSHRIAVASVAVVLVTSASIGVIAYRLVDRSVRPFERHAIEEHARGVADDLERTLAGVGADVLLLAALDGAAEVAAGSTPSSSARVEAFRALLRLHPEYLQACIVGLADGGRERLRVERSADGAVLVVSDDALQRKGERPYVVEALKLPPGALHASPIEPNEEFGAVQAPRIPVARFATPLHAGGAACGIVVVNVDMRAALERARRPLHADGSVTIVDEAGTLLVHDDRALEFGPAPANVLRAATGEDEDVGDASPDGDASLAGRAEERERIVAAMARARVPGGPRFTVVETAPEAAAAATTAAVWRSCLYAGTAATLASLLLAFLMSLALGRPLRRLRDAVEHYPGRPFTVPARGSDEVVALARSFHQMTQRVERNERRLQEELEARRHAEEELSRHLDRVRLLASAMESANHAVILEALDGTVLECNAAAERLYGYGAAELVGRPAAVLVPPDRRAEHEEIRRHVERGEQLRDVDTRRRRKDGLEVDVALTVSPVRSSTGRLIGASTLSHDVAERVATEERFRRAFEASPCGMILVDASGAIDMANDEAARMFGYAPSDLLGLDVEALVPTRFRAEHVAQRRAYAAHPEARRMGTGRELYGVKKDGTEFPIEVGLNPLEVRGSPMVMCIVNDIAVRREAQVAAARYAEELERSNQELEQFAYLASHDLQEPLRMVASYAELFAERYRPAVDERGEKYIGYVLEGAQRMRALITDLLQYSRVSTQAGEPRPTRLADVMDEVVADLAGTIRESCGSVTWSDLPVVAADPRQVQQLLRNLVANGLKFRRRDVAPRVRVFAVRRGAEAVVAVEDNGIGIDPAESGRLFQMFQRLHDRQTYPGNGIGLAVARKIVERHGGTLWFERAPEAGTVFKFSLPVVEDPA